MRSTSCLPPLLKAIQSRHKNLLFLSSCLKLYIFSYLISAIFEYSLKHVIFNPDMVFGKTLNKSIKKGLPILTKDLNWKN